MENGPKMMSLAVKRSLNCSVFVPWKITIFKSIFLYGCLSIVILVFRDVSVRVGVIPSWELRYSTLGKGKSSSKMSDGWDMFVPGRVWIVTCGPWCGSSNSLMAIPGWNFCRQVRQVFWKPRTFNMLFIVFHAYRFWNFWGLFKHCWIPVLILIPRTKRFATMASCCLMCAFERVSQRRGWGFKHGRCRKRDVYLLSTQIWLLFTYYIAGTQLILYFCLKYWDDINNEKFHTPKTEAWKSYFILHQK